MTGVFRRSSRTAWRSVSDLLLAAALVAGCGNASVTGQNIPFTSHGTTQQSSHGGGAGIAVASDPAQTGLAQLAPAASRGRLFIGVFGGTQRTGGYAIRVDRIVRSGDNLVVRATFTSPPSGALTIQVLTSPAQLVSIDQTSAQGARDALLVDQSGAERARTPVPQSRS